MKILILLPRYAQNLWSRSQYLLTKYFWMQLIQMIGEGQNKMEMRFFENLNTSNADWAVRMTSETEREQSFYPKFSIERPLNDNKYGCMQSKNGNEEGNVLCESFSIGIPGSMLDDTLKHLNASRIVLLSLLQFNATALAAAAVLKHRHYECEHYHIQVVWTRPITHSNIFFFEHQSLSGVHTKRV